MRVVFFGTPEWAVPSLEALARSHFDVVAVVTNPDRPAGRRLAPQAPPVKAAAEALGLPVAQPERVRTPEFEAWIKAQGADVAAVVAYGKILPANLLAIPRHGYVNLHFSLLPRYRGAAPVQRAIMNGERESGVSLMVLTEGMDEGPVLTFRTVEIGAAETAGELGWRLATLGAGLWADALDAYVRGDLRPVDQDRSRATYAPKVTPEEARLDWTRPSRSLHDLVRAMNPAPGAWTELRGLRIKVWATEPVDLPGDLEPGAPQSGPGLVVATGDGGLLLREVQVAGKKRMPGDAAARGLRVASDDRFG